MSVEVMNLPGAYGAGMELYDSRQLLVGERAVACDFYRAPITAVAGRQHMLVADPLNGRELIELLEDISPVKEHGIPAIVDDWGLPDEDEPMSAELTERHAALGSAWRQFMRERKLLLAAVEPYGEEGSPKLPVSSLLENHAARQGPQFVLPNTLAHLSLGDSSAFTTTPGSTRSFVADGRRYRASFVDIRVGDVHDAWTYYKDQTLQKVCGSLSLRPVLTWHETADGKLVPAPCPEQDVRFQNADPHEDSVVDSSVAGLLVAAALAPDVCARWPEAMRLPNGDTHQFMHAAQVPILALMSQRKILAQLPQ